MFNTIRLLFSVFFLMYLFFSVTLSYADSNSTKSQILKKHAGHYAYKPFWDMLPKIKIWSASGMSTISAIDIDDTGKALAIYAWHEGDEISVQLRGNELWVKEKTTDKKTSKWIGPYIRISSTDNSESAYFNRIFGQRCFKSNKNEQWCFAPGKIKVETKQYNAKIYPDTQEPSVPTYGTPVDVTGEKAHWVFVPWEDGWQVFLDTADESRPIDPKKTKPWRTLRQ